MVNFSALPKDKPAGGNATEGRHLATIFDAKMVDSKSTPGTKYLNVSFKLAKGGFVNENYFDSDKPFLQYKLSRLLTACGISLDGTGTLDDVRKVIKGRDVVIDVVINDKGYGALDYSGDNEGIYSTTAVEVAPTELETKTVTIDPELNEVVETDPFSVTDDSDF